MFRGWNDIDRMLGEMDVFREKMNRIFGGVGRLWSEEPEWYGGEGEPRANLYEEGEHFVMQVEVPGFEKEKLNVRLQGNYLEIRGEREDETPEGYTVHRQERGATTFARSFTLPVEIDGEKVEAQLANGILTLTLPKREIAKPKQIAVH